MQVLKLQLVREESSIDYGTENASDPGKAYQAMRGMLENLPREELHALYIDNKNRIVGSYMVGAGTIDSAPCAPREVFGPALLANACKIILVHNHPSGDPTPSNADKRLTERMVAAGKLMEVPVVDHIVIGQDAYISMRECGLM